MFQIGLFEIILTLSLALVILGPDKLFVVARYLGLMLRKLRVLYAQLTDEFDKQLRLDEMLKNDTLKSLDDLDGLGTKGKTKSKNKSRIKPKSKTKQSNKKIAK
ncbi:MAG: hypothetical protein HAW61_04145 [Candidatus Portiera sp.]|nr:hypothetical protein [Portiera sp.]